MLQKIDYPNQSSRLPLLVVHGLYGSARNWGVVCRKLSLDRPVHAVDNRNHGESKWFDTHSYTDLANDMADVIESEFGKAVSYTHLTLPTICSV
jgi:pimeloyl-ACP methyl ester carboxylesterase